jgi:hypothetical protein
MVVASRNLFPQLGGPMGGQEIVGAVNGDLRGDQVVVV